MSIKSVLAMIGLTLALALSLPAQTVRVLLVAGTADITPTGETVARPIVKGEAVTAGSTITTGADGRVVLTPMPGVKSIITPNSSITLESVSESRTDTATTYQAVLDLKVGAVVSDLDRPEGVAYDYSVRTPRGLAGARGTTFTVGVNAAGITTVIVSHGTITLNFNDGRSATLSPGKVSITKSDGSIVEAESVDGLSAEDQQLATEFTEVTLEAVANAIENGVELAPETLKNVLDTANGMGMSPDPSTTGGAALKVIQRKVDSQQSPNTNNADTKTVVTQQNNEGSSGGSALTTFRANLNADQQAAFDLLNATNQNLLLLINDPQLTTLVLAGDEITGARFTNFDLQINMVALTKLSPAAQTFFKQTNPLTNPQGPGPVEWSRASFDRSAVSWNSLSASQQNQLLALGAAEFIMDQSATYIGSILNKVQALPTDQRTGLLETGWGFVLFESENNSGFDFAEEALIVAGNLSSQQRATVRFYEIDPFSIIFNASSSAAALDELATLSPAQSALLRKMDATSDLLFHSLSEITGAIDAISALPAEAQTAVFALGLGEHYLHLGDSPLFVSGTGLIPVANRLQSILDAYLSLPFAQQEAVIDARVFDNADLSDSFYNPENLASIVNEFLALPARVRTVLVSGQNASFTELANSQSESFRRSLSEFVDLVQSLTDAELETLRDMEGSSILTSAFIEDSNATAKIKTAIAFYNNLGILQKFTLRELRILQHYSHEWLTVNQQGLARMLSAYASLNADLRAGTKFPDFFSGSQTITATSVFLNETFDVFDVSFISNTSELHVGAIRNLVIRNGNFGNEDPTFDTATNGSLFLRASDLIDLENVEFGFGIRSITMEAATINLTNVDFPDLTVVALNSQLGAIHFDSIAPGHVNFLGGVTYGGVPINDPTSFSNFGQNIHLGTLANPVKASDFSYQPIGNVNQN